MPANASSLVEKDTGLNIMGNCEMKLEHYSNSPRRNITPSHEASVLQRIPSREIPTFSRSQKGACDSWAAYNGGFSLWDDSPPGKKTSVTLYIMI